MESMVRCVEPHLQKRNYRTRLQSGTDNNIAGLLAEPMTVTRLPGSSIAARRSGVLIPAGLCAPASDSGVGFGELINLATVSTNSPYRLLY